MISTTSGCTKVAAVLPVRAVGDRRVDDATSGQFEAAHLPALDLHTADGHVRQP